MVGPAKRRYVNHKKEKVLNYVWPPRHPEKADGKVKNLSVPPYALGEGLKIRCLSRNVFYRTILFNIRKPYLKYNFLKLEGNSARKFTVKRIDNVNINLLSLYVARVCS